MRTRNHNHPNNHQHKRVFVMWWQDLVVACIDHRELAIIPILWHHFPGARLWTAIYFPCATSPHSQETEPINVVEANRLSNELLQWMLHKDNLELLPLAHLGLCDNVEVGIHFNIPYSMTRHEVRKLPARRSTRKLIPNIFQKNSSRNVRISENHGESL